jgi:Uma2 family endonuclease
MTVISSTPSLSSADLERLEHDGGVELVNGKIVEKPVSAEAARIIGTIIWLLRSAAAQGGQVSIFSETLAYQCFADDPTKTRRPDISVIRRERLVGFDQRSGFIHFPADLAVEVLSPNDRVYQVGDKVEEYLQAGFGLVWVVDPNTRTVVVHRPDAPPALLHENDEIDCGPLVPAFRHKVSDFFVG